MNERIRELAIQSGLPTALDYHQKRYEKFAQLIVAECQEVVRWAISVDSTIKKVPVLIQEHFRVEE